MSNPEAVPPSARPIDPAARTDAFTALALALLGTLGGGVVANAFQVLTIEVFDGAFAGGLFGQLALHGLLAAGFGAAGLALANRATASADLLAAPVARAAKILALVAIVGGAALLLAGFLADR